MRARRAAQTSATASMAMIAKSSRRPVSLRMDCPCGTSTVGFRPSGVISYTQAKITTAGKPHGHQHQHKPVRPHWHVQHVMSGRALYHAVITRRLGANQKRAGEIVRRAEVSFTNWPAEKELRFHHVVHYQVFDEFTHSGPGRENTRTNVGRVVARIIPEQH